MKRLAKQGTNKISSLKEKKKNPTNNYGVNAVLRIEGFKKLWIGQIFSQLADKFYIVLMVSLIAQYWAISAADNNEGFGAIADTIQIDIATNAQIITLLSTGIYIANTIPAILIGSFAGIAADRWPKRRLMVTSNSIRAILVFLIPICLYPGPTWMGIDWGYWALIGMTFIESSLTQFFAPAEQAIIPLLVPKKHLLAANSLYQATSMGATIIGFALGEIILELFRNTFLKFGINGGQFLLLPFCYAFAAYAISTIQLTEITSHNTNKNVWQELKDGFYILQQRPTIRSALLHLIVLYSLLAALYVLTISIASSIDGLGPTRFGILLATSAIGMTFGAIVLAQVGSRFSKRHISATGLGAITLALILLGQSKSSLMSTLFLCAILGIGSALVAIPAQTTIQEDTPESDRGKVFGIQNNFINIALSLPLIVAGALVSKYGLIPALWLLASVALIAGILEQPWKRC